MPRLKVLVYRKGQTEPETVITIPLPTLRAAMRLMPTAVREALEREGIDLSCLNDMVGDQGLKGTLIEVEKATQKIAITLE